MNTLKKIFVILAMVGLMLPSFALADEFGLDKAAAGTKLIPVVDTQTDVPNLIGKIVGVALSFVGAIFFLLILYAGFLWMTAFGSSEKVDKSKEILIHAVIGLIIVLAAYAISKFVFGALTGENTSATAENSTLDANVICPQLETEPECYDPRLVDNAGTPLCMWIEIESEDGTGVVGSCDSAN